MDYEVIVDDDAGFRAFDVIIERWKATPKKFPYDQPRAIIPQNIIPDSLREDKEELCNFYFYICLYMRGGIESLQAFRAMIGIKKDYPEFFDPFHAQHLKHEELQPILKDRIGWDSNAVARYWIENSKRLSRNWNGSTVKLFKNLRSYNEALRRIRNKRTKKELVEAEKVDDRGEGFMGFQPKMVSMLIYFLDWEGLLEKQFLYPTPADFHNFRFGLGLGIITIEPQPASLRSAEAISKPWRDLTVRYLTKRRSVTPVELADAIWLFSLTICGESPLTDYHERKDRNGHGIFKKKDLAHSRAPSFLAPSLRNRLTKTCLSCPLIDQCRFAVPARPYYSKKGDRKEDFGGRLYLIERFPIEDHFEPFEVEYLPRTEAPKVDQLLLSELLTETMTKKMT